MSGVYDGLTVVELADRRNQWAGKLLADGDVRVIQIEPGSVSFHCGCAAVAAATASSRSCSFASAMLARSSFE